MTDFYIEAKRNKPFVMLQFADMQSKSAEEFERLCIPVMKEAFEITKPDFIYLSGDNVESKYDQDFKIRDVLLEVMESFGVPWGTVWGNHDTDRDISVTELCKAYSEAKNCMFARGPEEIEGNCNYTIGIGESGVLKRIFYMMDSNGCEKGNDPSIIDERGIYDGQLRWLLDVAKRERAANGNKVIPGSAFFHIPCHDFHDAFMYNGYHTIWNMGEDGNFFIGSKNDVPPVADEEYKEPVTKGDGGYKNSNADIFPKRIVTRLREAYIDSIFCGHSHNVSTSIYYHGVRYSYGVKTGQTSDWTNGRTGASYTVFSSDMSEFEVKQLYLR